MGSTSRSPADYTVGWICALPLEMAAAKAMLDESHQRLPQPPNDDTIYTLGSLHSHNIVIACLPVGVYGTTSAAVLATRMAISFPALRFGLMVGIGGGVPHLDTHDLRLGDVVVSKPTGSLGGVVQYDMGKSLPEGHFQRTGALNKPPSVLLEALATLQADHMLVGGLSQIPTYLTTMLRRYPAMAARFSHPGSHHDLLFEPPPPHYPAEQSHQPRLVPRPPRASWNPRIHYGLIASGNQVMRDASTRDILARTLEPGQDVLCFDMEAAGLMDNFPCLVIRGVCDYADAQKNKLWQEYAAAVAAAYAKELLSVLPVRQVWKTEVVREVIGVVEQEAMSPTSKTRPHRENHIQKKKKYYIYQGDTKFNGSIRNNSGVIMGNINSTGGTEAVRIQGSSSSSVSSSGVSRKPGGGRG